MSTANTRLIASLALLTIGGCLVYILPIRSQRSLGLDSKRRVKRLEAYKNPFIPDENAKRKFTIDQFDIIPRIGSRGSKGGWCLVQYRVKTNYPKGLESFKKELIKSNFEINKMTNHIEFEHNAYYFANLIPTTEQAKFFKFVQITSHAIMMMDFRGIPMSKLRAAFNEFLPKYRKFMLANYTSSGVLMLNPQIQIPDMQGHYCRSFERDIVDGKDPKAITGITFILMDKGIEFVFRTSGFNTEASAPYEIFNNVFVVTAIQVNPPHVIDKGACNDNVGVLVNNTTKG